MKSKSGGITGPLLGVIIGLGFLAFLQYAHVWAALGTHTGIHFYS
jgi:hypothetical protein